MGSCLYRSVFLSVSISLVPLVGGCAPGLEPAATGDPTAGDDDLSFTGSDLTDSDLTGSDSLAIRRPWRPRRPWRDPAHRPDHARPGDDDSAADDSAASDDTGAGEDTGVAEDAGTTEVLSPVPYGFWGLNGYHSDEGLDDLVDRFGLAVFQASSSNPTWTVSTLLPMAREAGVTVTLRMSGGTSSYTDDRGDFDIDAWKEALEPWGESGVQEFIDDGTLVGHMLLDDIHTFSGTDPTGDELDELARYSKALMPGLMTFVRCQATTMPEPTGGVYVHVDAAVNQYNVRQGDIEAYAEDEAAAAVELDLGIINGLNIANGGDGSSDQPGWQAGMYAMSADEIARYGAVLVDMPGLGMFLNWEYDGEEEWADGSVGTDYLDQPEVQAALAELGEQVASTERTVLLRD